jgi:hypothetical protein
MYDLFTFYWLKIVSNWQTIIALFLCNIMNHNLAFLLALFKCHIY